MAASSVIMMLGNTAIAQGWENEDGFSIGLAGAVSTNPYVGQGTELVPYPSVTYRSGPLSIGTFGLSYEGIETNRLSISAGISPRFSGLYSTDAPQLKGIDRKITGDLALSAAFEFSPAFKSEMTFRQEVTGEHNGQELILDMHYGTTFGDITVEASAGAAWQSSDLSSYIWGVSSTESRPNRRAYTPGSVVIPYASISAVMPFTERWTLVSTLRADFLPDEVSNSPIIDQNNIYSAAFGLTYSF